MDELDGTAAQTEAFGNGAPGAQTSGPANGRHARDVRPTIRLDASGTIIALSASASAMLSLTGTEYDTCFFTHVDRRQLLPVMRDIAAMVCHGKKDARWLIRMRTGRSGWRWVRAHAVRVPRSEACEIRITLANVSD